MYPSYNHSFSLTLSLSLFLSPDVALARALRACLVAGPPHQRAGHGGALLHAVCTHVEAVDGFELTVESPSEGMTHVRAPPPPLYHVYLFLSPFLSLSSCAYKYMRACLSACIGATCARLRECLRVFL